MSPRWSHARPRRRRRRRTELKGIQKAVRDATESFYYRYWGPPHTVSDVISAQCLQIKHGFIR